MMKITNKLIWEHLKEGKPLDYIILLETTGELQEWVNRYVNSLTEMFNVVKNVCELTYKQYLDDDELTEEDIFKIVVDRHKDFHEILIKMYNGEDVDDIIWDKIKPEIIVDYKGKLNLENSIKNTTFTKTNKNVKN